ncbi:MAG TPA: YitT family protein [Ferruginibacter sp.]|nr:YitT family protein [Ferruginibacter sp.]HPH91840.1 YitT family protein [Ferruginibacter sp.]
MRKNWLYIINRILDDKSLKLEQYSDYRNAKQYLEFKISITRLIKDFFFIVAGIFSATFGFKGFLLTNHFIDGGATGISLLISSITGYPLYILLICVNIPFIIMAYKVMGRNFAIKTTLAICGLALCVATVDFPNVTNDNLLVAIFGGFFLGAGIGMAVRGGAVIDGTEVLAIFLSKKFGITIGDVIILINIVIFSAAAKFLGINIALYSMITYLSASRTLDFIVEGIEEYIAVTIVSSHHEEIREMIINKLGRGVTIITGKRGFGKHGDTKDIDIIYSVITRLEVHKMNTEIQKIDPNSFVVMTSVKDTKGGMIKKRPLKH